MRSLFVRIAYTLEAMFWLGGSVVGGVMVLVLGIIGAHHNPELWFLFAVRTTLLLDGLITIAFSFWNQASNPESQNCPTDSNDM